MRVAMAMAVLGICAASSFGQTRPAEPVYVDGKGVIRWTTDQREVALFGVNYCLPSASDFRAVGYFGADRKKVVDQDMVHLARMGFDGLRLSFWGDYENSDEKGNLIANVHLDLLDYVIAKASERHIYMMLSPIVTYDANWPDGKDAGGVRGLSQHFKKAELGTNPEAIAAQQNYLRQLLDHVNPYTGRALKDEPNILFVEMINEPWHHPDDVAGSVRYINALVDALRSTGCQKLTFHNVSQAFNMAGPIAESRVDGSTFAWYPSGLNAGHQLRGNFLRYLDSYPPMLDPKLAGKPKLIYEFDLPDVISGYHYPAMARTFRQVGAQFATVFSYDMIASASHNMGWTTHLLNLVYTPKKAVGAIIAGEVMHKLPRYGTYGAYPENRTFGDFRVSYEEDLAEEVTPTTFMYSGDTKTVPPDASTLEKIVGFGSSPVVKYDGLGSYFLEKIDDGRWRLEVYPDALQVADPFRKPSPTELKFRLVRQERKMTLALPDLGEDFDVRSPNPSVNWAGRAKAGTFAVNPGVYVIARRGTAGAALPDRWGNLGFDEFVCPPDEKISSPSPPIRVPASRPVGGDLTLVDAGTAPALFETSRHGWSPVVASSGSLLLRFAAGPRRGGDPADLPRQGSVGLARSLFVGDLLAGRSGAPKSLVVKVRCSVPGSTLKVTLVEKDGAAWGTTLAPTAEWSESEVSLADLKSTSWALLPLGYPGDWNASATPTPGPQRPGEIERMQLSVLAGKAAGREDGIEVERVALRY